MVRDLLSSSAALEQLCETQRPHRFSGLLNGAAAGGMLVTFGLCTGGLTFGTGASARDHYSEGMISSALFESLGALFCGAISLGLVGGAGYQLLNGVTSVVRPGFRNRGMYAFRNEGYIKDPKSVDMLMGSRVIPLDAPDGLEAPHSYFMNGVKVDILSERVEEIKYHDSEGSESSSSYVQNTKARGTLKDKVFDFAHRVPHNEYPVGNDIPTDLLLYLLLTANKEGLVLTDMGDAILTR